MYAKVILDLKIPKLNYAFVYKIPENLKNKIKVGISVFVPFGKINKITKGFVVEIEKNIKSDYDIKTIIDIDKNKIFPNKNMLLLANKIKDFYFIPYSEALKLMSLSLNNNSKYNIYENSILFVTQKGINFYKCMKKSKKKELLGKFIKKNIFANELKNESNFKKNIIFFLKNEYIEIKKLKIDKKNIFLNELNSEQKNSFKFIKKSIEKTNFNVFLLFGITGSGKTEVYFHAINEAIKLEKQILVLLPEINLTEQMISRFEKVFPNNVAKWHSKISQKEKRKIILDFENKNKNILIGSRSAIFVPLNNLGLIIVDEEHDSSYYQDNMPVYNAKKVAIMRGEIEKITILLGSATPAIESYYQAEIGNYKLLNLKKGFFVKKKPEIEIINMSLELKKGNFSIFSNKLKNNIYEKLKNKKKIILFINRRGFYNFFLCRDCGFVLKCENCEIPLIYHIQENKMICHYCGKKKEYNRICPKCKSKRFRGIGVGTEQVVEFAKNLFKNKKIKRFDSDIKINLKKKQEILNKFKNGEIDILVGTQIISKGIDFPNVDLIGILLADLSLNISDYRAKELTFQLMLQIIGRAGRRNENSKVLIQTYYPFNNIFDKIIKQDYYKFYKEELLFRKKLNYPPFSEIFKLQIKGEKEEKVIKTTFILYRYFKKKFLKEEIFLPKRNFLKKIHKKYNWYILFKIKYNNKKLEEVEEFYKKFLKIFYKKYSNNEISIYFERDPKGLI